MRSVIRHYLLALQFFTRIPVTGRLAAWVGFSPQALQASAAHLPGVGWLVGGLIASLFGLLCWALPALPASPWLAAALSTAFGALLTGALHEDGLADLTDGLGGSMNRERALQIMKDSRIGSFGALALVLALLVKLAAIAALAQSSIALACAGVFGAHVISRWWPLAVMRFLPYVSAEADSKAGPLVHGTNNQTLLVGMMWCLPALAILMWWQGDVAWWPAVVVSALAALAVARLLWTRLQGVTGDGLGATQQVSELAFYIGLLLGLPAGAA